MAVTVDAYAPFDSGPGANSMEDTWRKMMRHMLTSGAIHGITNGIEVFADSTGMQVKVKTGELWIRGHWGEITSQKTLSLAAAHATLARVDRIVARCDFVNNRIEVDVLQGANGGSAPSVTQNASIWEVSLATVSVPGADASIDAAQVTDDREWAEATTTRGFVAEVKRATNDNNITGETVMETLTVQLVRNRRYTIRWETLYNCASAHPTFRIRNAAGASVTTAGTDIRGANIEGNNGTNRPFGFTATFTAPTTGQYTFGTTGQAGAALNVPGSTTGRLFLIEDVGP